MTENILILGANGMLGHTVFDYLSKHHNNVLGLSRNEMHGNNIKNFQVSFNAEKNDSLDFLDSKLFLNTNIDHIVNCIGSIKPRIQENSSESIQSALKINSYFPHYLAQFATKRNIKVIQIATDCVYSGLRGSYSEDDPHDPLDVYGKTKSLGEVNNSQSFLNLRCSIIGKEKNRSTSLMEWVLNQPINSNINGYEDHNWNGVTTLAYAKVVSGIIKNKIVIDNTINLVPRDVVNKYELLNIIKDYGNRNDITVNRTNSEKTIDRTITTKYDEQNRDLWGGAGYQQIPTIKEMIKEYFKSL
jgi:dTDP-4-dehydrorhamnose reductase